MNTRDLDRELAPPHVRSDRILTEVLLPDRHLPHPLAQVNYIQVSNTGQECPEHWHSDYFETFLCLEGIVTLHLESVLWSTPRIYELHPQERVSVAPGVRHSLTASPYARYLELRSTVYNPKSPGKEFVRQEDAARIGELNSQAQELQKFQLRLSDVPLS